MKTNNNNSGTLYIVATPIGNLEDITLRAIRILKEVDFILCEDTRVTKRLLEKYNLQNNLIAYKSDDQVKDFKSPLFQKIIENLTDGQNGALVTDAGTPGISDPGNLLVSLLQTKNNFNFKIEPVPGPSALSSAVSVSGFLSNKFVFLGFPPHKKGRQTFFKDLATYELPVFFYESKHRLLKTLKALKDFLPKNSKIFIGREMTKIYEELLWFDIDAALKYFSDNPAKIRGEFVIGILSKN